MRVFSLCFLLLIMAQTASAQGRNQNDDAVPKPNSLEETLTRANIDRAEENHRKLVTAAEEMNTIASDLLKDVQAQQKLSNDSEKKLEKVEKLAKKVRSGQGAGGIEDLESKPATLIAAVEQLQKATEMIEKEISHLTRHGVSATLVERLNEVLVLTHEIKRQYKAK
jgi:hypothetical protein